ncbi:MAG: LEA type 2 family protein [Planctomycetes bacterium]|nr:LEA type 2 family protein [Planctomycetota bacterium]
MRNRFLDLFALSAVLLTSITLGGCSTINLPEKPVVSLVNIELGDVTVFETSATVVVRVSNPNLGPITVKGTAFDVALDGCSLGKALGDEVIEVPALNSATTRARVHLSNIAMATKIKSIIDSRRFDYSIDGVLYLEADGKKGSLRTSNSGRIDAKDFIPKNGASR